MKLCLWAALILSCLLLLIYVKIKIQVELSLNQGQQKIYLKIMIGILAWSRHYDYNNAVLPDLIIEKLINNQEGSKRDKGIISGVSSLKRFYKLSRSIWLTTRKGLDYVIIENIRWQSSIGHEDAMYAALGTGVISSFQGMAISFLSRTCTLKEISYNVKPYFGTSVFFTRMTCILKIRFVHIIITVIYAIFIIVRWGINGYTTGKTEPSN